MTVETPDPVAIVHRTGEGYLRSGTCDGCRRPGLQPGQCCKLAIFELKRALTPVEICWAELHPGFHLEDDGATLVLDFPCGALGPSGRCMLHDTSKRPSICELWPIRPEHVARFDGCAYTFQELQEA